MAIDSVDTLLAVLRRTQLLTPEQVKDVARELQPHYKDPYDLGQYLVEIDWLTTYQLQLLFAGRWDELTIGPFQVLAQLGEGGISEVYKAWDTVKGREVALKVMRPQLADRPDAERQFQRELQAVTRLSHPNVIKTFDAGQAGAVHFLAMEYVEGMDLDKFVRKVGPLPLDMACDYIRQAAQGLQHAHQLGLVHRDVKPANLFLLYPPLPPEPDAPPRRAPDPVVKVIDWGLARLKPPEGASAVTVADAEAEKGALIGTADYIAPEQARDASVVDIRADVYSLGCTLYYLLTGQPPFPGASLMQKILQHQEAEPPAVQALRPDVPEEVGAIVEKMLAKKAEDRYQIPLLVVAPLRRFCTAVASANGSLLRPAGNGVAGQRPASAPTLLTARPGTSPNLKRPASASSLPRPGSNGATPHRP
jgi:serine/threonine-protein kinase